MITLHTWTTPNGRKASIMLEEVGLPYRVVPVNIGQNQQFSPDFLAIAPNNKIPAIVDDEAEGGPLAIFESGAILTYLAEKTGQLLPQPVRQRYEVLEWLHWQIGGLGPMLGQLGAFWRAPEKVPQAIERYTKEAERLLQVMEKRLSASPFLGGPDYSIADIAAYPWTVAATTMLSGPLESTLASTPSVHRWLATIGDRPAVQRGMDVPKKA